MTDKNENSNGFRRLSSNLKPSKYELTIHPDLRSFKFFGKVTIHLIINEETDFIELHSVKLNFTNVQYILSNQIETIDYVRSETFEKYDLIRLYFAKKLSSGKLMIEFDGILNDSLQGFYKTKCLNRNGLVEYAACTQFEAADARRAFPCFDEPDFKAVFDVSIIAENHKTVLSNMPLKEKSSFDVEKNLSTYFFETTPVMSTYLLAFIVGEYDFVEKKIESGTTIRVYTPVNKTHMGNFSLDLTGKALKFYTEYFGIEYPLPKLDLIALGDVEIEAMENWGLITFKESLLLIDPDNYTIQTRGEVALVVSHEIAHQWFGNIVTMEWWTDLWLNEGFATWIEYLSVDHCFPDWNIWDYYATDHLFRAYDLDSLVSSHPIEVKVNAPNEISQIFDSISYCKGSSIIRMLNNFIGNKNFIKGLHAYLEKFKYKNATTDDLWNELNNASNIDVKNLMRNWTQKKGYPLVNVSKKVNGNGNTILELTQQRFLKNPQEVDSSMNTLWSIPITIKTKSSFPHVFKEVLMVEQSMELDLGSMDENELIYLNSDNVGFYRVKYSKEMFEIISNEFDKTKLFGTSLDKFGFISDTFAMAWSNNISASDLLRVIWIFRNETDTHVWITLLKNLHLLSKCLINTPVYDNFKKFLKQLISKISVELGFEEKENEDDLRKLLRENVLYLMAKIDDTSLLEFSRMLYENRLIKKIPSNLQKPVYASILRHSTSELLEEFVLMYIECKTPEEKEKIALLLSEVTQEDLIEKVLEFAFSSIVTLEESVYIIVSLAQNSTSKHSAMLAWSFIKKNWSLFYERFSDSLLIGRLLKPLIQSFSTEEMIEEIKEFFEEHPTPEADLSIKQGLEIIKSNVFFINSQLKEIESFFSSF